MTARVAAASLAIHIAAVIALVVAGSAAHRPPVIDVEIVPPVITTEAAPPPARGAGGSPGGERIADRTPPVRRPEPPRTRTLAHRKAPAAPAPAPVATDQAPHGTDVRPDEPPAGRSDDDAQGAGNAIAGGEGGLGTGTGVGDGAGAVDLDLSAPPVPLASNTSEVLPYTEEAMRDRITGYVHLVLMVDPRGHVGRVTLRRGLGHGLDEIATRRAMQIPFRPARDRTGQPTVGTVRWRFHFQPP